MAYPPIRLGVDQTLRCTRAGLVAFGALLALALDSLTETVGHAPQHSLLPPPSEPAPLIGSLLSPARFYFVCRLEPILRGAGTVATAREELGSEQWRVIDLLPCGFVSLRNPVRQ